jgi:hypothetical protein
LTYIKTCSGVPIHNKNSISLQTQEIEMKRSLYFTGLLIFALAGCASPQGMKGGANSADHAQHMEHMKTMKESMARIRQSTDPTERQKLIEEHMKMMDEHMAGMQNMSCGKM